jgi:DNA-binding MarR family transcriptional regulator
MGATPPSRHEPALSVWPYQSRLSTVAAAPDPEEVAAVLRVNIGLLRRRLRQAQLDGDLTFPQHAALARLDRGGPSTSSVLAKLEQISPQSMGATLAELEARGLVDRSADPGDGRRVILSITDTGRRILGDRRNARTEQLGRALAEVFTPDELATLMAAAPLLERLAQNI